MKNQNKIIAVVFFAIAALMSALEFLYVADRFPIGFLSAVTALEILLTVSASAVFIVGTAIKSRSVLITAESIFTGSLAISLMTAVMHSEMENVLCAPLAAVSLTAVVIMLIYTSGALKNKYIPAAIMTMAIASQLCLAFFAATSFLSTVYVTEAIVFSALTVMAIYPDLSGERHVRTAEMLWLSAVTFGVYLAVWAAFIVKEMAKLTGKKGWIAGAAAFIIFSPYRLYWYYTAYEEQSTFKNRGIFLAAVSAFGTLISVAASVSGVPAASLSGSGVSLAALAIIQRDLNSLVPKEEETVPCAPADSPEPAAEE